MDYWLLPPEVNSARIYSGPGPVPLLDAQLAWQSLAESLADSVAQCSSLVGTLAGAWTGPSSETMQTSATRYLSWLSQTSERAHQSALQAGAAAATAAEVRSTIIPPSSIAMNRARLSLLVATNILGQNTPAIMAVEAEYAEYWVADVLAMFDYQSASQSAVAGLPKHSPPPAVANPAAATTAPSWPDWLQMFNNSNDVFGPNANMWNSILTGGLNPATLAPLMGQLALAQQANAIQEREASANERQANDADAEAEKPPTASISSLVAPSTQPAVQSTLGQARATGSLSVPPAWDRTVKGEEVKLASAATPLPAGGTGMMPTPIAAVNSPAKEKKRGEEVLHVKFILPKGI